METVYLQGSEEIGRAGNAMREAAGEMNRAVANLEGALLQHQRFMDDWLLRLTDLMERKEAMP